MLPVLLHVFSSVVKGRYLADCPVSAQSLIDATTCDWNVIAQRDVYGTQKTEGSIWAARDIAGWAQISYNYPNGNAPRPDHTTVFAGGIISTTHQALKIPYGHARSGSGPIPTITRQSDAAKVYNLANDPSITTDIIDDMITDLQCLQRYLCSLEPTQDIEFDHKTMVFDAASPNSPKDITIYQLNWDDLSAEGLEARNFGLTNSVVINIVDIPSDASWRWNMKGDFPNYAEKTLLNFCGYRGNFTAISEMRASTLFHGADCYFESDVHGGIYGCVDIHVPQAVIHGESWCPPENDLLSLIESRSFVPSYEAEQEVTESHFQHLPTPPTQDPLMNLKRIEEHRSFLPSYEAEQDVTESHFQHLPTPPTQDPLMNLKKIEEHLSNMTKPEIRVQEFTSDDIPGYVRSIIQKRLRDQA